ncbi:PREDICTED: uncharacterized protein LOC105312978 [Amphimedon queenslandica]|uniref:NmrA-like domain-containing protein n=1 Tax=Amphimedon queenslandica TaxID=400682 RepID=A0A1X7UPP7_AMPQE|nr:PREDICTED: uncharacterized protein LOC105312978 [Amphimedon queenslandica]|eukprot:XP_011404341.1 PREDICTED: uncharacterized protein LOC105312978 [Amphimedon queenslandica]
MAEKPIILVTGSSGNIGSATVGVLAARYADKVEIRAGVRNPDKIPARPGVTVVQAVMGDKDQLREPLKDVDAVFIVTPTAEDRAALTIKTAEAAKEAGVKFILIVSAPSMTHPDGRVEYLPTCTIFGKQYHEIDSQIPKLGVPYAFLRLSIFMENNFGKKDTIVDQSTFYASQSPDKPAIYVAVEDAAKAAAAILTDYSKHNGKEYNMHSDCYTNAELAAAFTEALGKEVKFVQVPPETAKQAMVGKGWSEWHVDGILEMLELIEEGDSILTVGDTCTLRSLTGEEPTSMKEWVTKNAPSFK